MQGLHRFIQFVRTMPYVEGLKAFGRKQFIHRAVVGLVVEHQVGTHEFSVKKERGFQSEDNCLIGRSEDERRVRTTRM